MVGTWVQCDTLYLHIFKTFHNKRLFLKKKHKKLLTPPATKREEEGRQRELTPPEPRYTPRARLRSHGWEWRFQKRGHKLKCLTGPGKNTGRERCATRKRNNSTAMTVKSNGHYMHLQETGGRDGGYGQGKYGL